MQLPEGRLKNQKICFSELHPSQNHVHSTEGRKQLCEPVVVIWNGFIHGKDNVSQCPAVGIGIPVSPVKEAPLTPETKRLSTTRYLVDVQ
jgi:hypothetical protein